MQSLEAFLHFLETFFVMCDKGDALLNKVVPKLT